ncbi:MAG: hypothetical protein E7214_12195 [Clostridium sp.]|nr:hypothetical protein [Clostridium sp.]
MAILVLLIGFILVVVNFKAIKNEKKNSFNDILINKQDNMSDLELKIAEVRKDMAESLLDIQQEILELKNNLYIDENNIKGKNSNEIDKKENELSYLLNVNSDVIDNVNKKSKTKRIEEFLNSGLNEDEICEKLKLGKGEVQLVKELLKKQKK